MIAGLLLLAIPQGLAAAPPPIVNGETTADFPAVGALTAELYGDDYEFCSGTLVASNFVLTAGHCVEAALLYQSYGLALDFLLASDVSDSSTVSERSPVEALYSHPDYNASTLENDLGLVQLSTPLSEAPYPMGAEPPDGSWYGEDLRFVGFGITGDNLEDNGTKRTADLPVVYFDSESVWTYDKAGENACSGDSGGAALRILSDGSYEVVGPISFVYAYERGQEPCNQGGAGVARIDNEMDWIEQVLAENVAPDGGDTGAPAADTGGAVDEAPLESTTGSAYLVDEGKGCSAAPSRGGLAGLLLALAGLALTRRRLSR